MPDNENAVRRLLAIKNRDEDKGLILIAGSRRQFDEWIDTDAELPSTAADPVTWIAPVGPKTPPWIHGRFATVAVRLVDHPVAAELCLRADSPLVYTSANHSGTPATKDLELIRRQFSDQVDCVVSGACGPAQGSSKIRDIETGEIYRASST
jgi:L-threonylcarbamoyladenylate synthase